MGNQNKYLDMAGVKYLWDTVESIYQKQEPGKSLSDNNFSDEEKSKLEELQNYSLPVASEQTLGGIKIGGGLVVNEDGVVSAVFDPLDAIGWEDIENLPTTVAGYGITDAATKDELEELRKSVTVHYTYKGTVPTVADLDNIQEPQDGDIYGVTENGLNYVWNATEETWKNLGSMLVVESLSSQEIDDICQ